MKIVLTYTTLDRCYVRRQFKTLAGAQAFGQKYVGEAPEISERFHYAVSADGVGKITVSGWMVEGHVRPTVGDIFPRSVG
jgi:hypothetical protein